MAHSSGLEFLDIHPFIREGVLDRVRGTIFGGALGDAVGLYTEFLSKDLLRAAYPDRKFQLVDPATELKNDGHRNKFVKAAWTDDTDHALLIVLSYLHNGRLDPLDFARRLQFWCEQGLRCLDRLPLGLGRTVGRVVCDRRFLDSPTETAYRHWKTSNYTSAPNGSLMRTAPLGIICLGKTQEETFEIAAEFSSITHPDPRCIVACGLVTMLVRDILDGQLRTEADLERLICSAETRFQEWITRQNLSLEEAAVYPDFDHEEYEKHVSAESLEDLQLDDGTKIGYVYKALGAGISVLRQGLKRLNSGELPDALFEELITELVLQGGDADTNATVAGALLGALLGYRTLPWKWKDGLMHRQWLFQKSDALASVLGIHPFPLYDSEGDPDNQLDGGKPPLTKDQLERREAEFVKGYFAKSGQQADQKQTGWVSSLFRKAAAWPLEGGI